MLSVQQCHQGERLSAQLCTRCLNDSSEYPNRHRSLKAIIAGGLNAVCESCTLIRKGIPGAPGSALTSVHSTPVLKEGETDGDDHGEWTTVMRKNCHESLARENCHGSLTKKGHHGSPAKGTLGKSQLGPKQVNVPRTRLLSS